MFVLKRTSDGKYVAKTGYHCTYTKDIDKVKGFSTYEEAMLNLCPQSEIVVKVIDIFTK